MLDFHTLSEFSRTNCIGICTFLVPANILTTVLTITLAVINRPSLQIWQAASVAGIFATLMILHVYTWFMVGIVLAPTYILLGLAITCLIANVTTLVLKKHFFHNQNISQNA